MSFRSKRLCQSADGQCCPLCGAYGTTIAAHANRVALGKGTGIKAPDFYAAWMCQICHDLYDGRIGKLTKAEKDEMWMTAYLRTVKQWFEQGIVVVK